MWFFILLIVVGVLVLWLSSKNLVPDGWFIGTCGLLMLSVAILLFITGSPILWLVALIVGMPGLFLLDVAVRRHRDGT